MKTTAKFFNPRPHAVMLALLAIGWVPGAVLAQTSTNVGTVSVTGEGDKLGNGLMIEEDSSKSKSTVTRSAMEKVAPTNNPFQLLQLAPGVSTYNVDGTGLFGGQLKVRGLNSDQLGFTINGAPVNDSGNFAVYPQEYTDTENLCEVFVTQGSADTESPHVGASGGNVGMVTCEPADARRGRVSQTLGMNNLSRTFVRIDTGKLGDFKAFVSASKTTADKWKGQGGADRDHVDAGWAWNLTRDTSFSGSVLYNKALNNNFLSMTKAEYAAYGPKFDYSGTVPQHLPAVFGIAQNEATTANFSTSSSGATPRAVLPYYGYALNPFENYLLTTRLATKVNDELTLSAEPYYWGGYGTGGVQQTTLKEGAAGSNLGGGIKDINKDGDVLDTVGVYRGSVTKTSRPGITLKANWNFDNQRILAGYWMERAVHRQTAPATTVDNNGNIADIWLSNPADLLQRADGTLYQNRDWRTVNTATSLFAQDTVTLMGGRLDFTPAVRLPSIKRDFTNYASEGSSSGATYNVQRTYSDVLPSLGGRYKLDDRLQLFGNVTKNMRAPSNFVLSGAVAGGTYQNGVLTGNTLNINDSVQKETSVSTEGGIRYAGETFNASATLFNTSFKNRISTSYDPITATNRDFNVGGVQMRGLEAEIGTKPAGGMSYYSSLTLNDSKMLNDYRSAVNTYLATTGMRMPDMPKAMLAASAQYSTGPYLVALSGKYTSAVYSTLMNDEQIPGYATFNLNAAYRLESSTFFKNTTLRLNMSNIFDKRYLALNQGSGSSITTTVDTTKGSGSGIPSYYVGAPRFASITLSTDF